MTHTVPKTRQTTPSPPHWEVKDGCCFVIGAPYTIALSTTDGSILFLSTRGRSMPILCGGEHGLWYIRFRSGSVLSAKGLAVRAQVQGNVLNLNYEHPQARVTAQVIAHNDYVDWIGEVTSHTEAVLDLALPARLRFDPTQLTRLICPMDGNQSVGMALRAGFFQQQPEEYPSAWRPVLAGSEGYIGLFGNTLIQRPDDDAPVDVFPTEEARRWLPDEAIKSIAGARAIVNRPSRREQLDVVLVSSPNGDYFGARRIGSGYLWRTGGRVESPQKALVQTLVTGVLKQLDIEGQVGIIALPNAPRSGGWSAVTVDEWEQSLTQLESATRGRVKVVPITSIPALLKALREGTFPAVINPYGEWLPAPPEGISVTLEAIRRYVVNGGHWFEVGGYPFYYALQPVRYFSMRVSYPPAFADFLHWETRAGSASLYRVQPRTWQAWNRQNLFVPGWLAWGGDERGGYAERAFGTYVEPGKGWHAPTVRLIVGKTAPQALQLYAEANGIHRRLAQKMPPTLLERFKRAVLVYYAGNAKEKTQHLPHLPVPSLIHFADYLKGGFDKEYPDHLPPHPQFGTPQEFAAFLREARRKGHLVMPYTNPTWWCDNPKGPTFQREGEAPLLRTLDGQLSRERYADNEGYTICFWHPAVQEANRRTCHQFTKEFPVDILFQDQCGARGWQYDTNPASPTPYAYTEGLLSMVAEDSDKVPLSTESGWDHIANYVAQMSGMGWSLVPTEHAPDWVVLLREQYPRHLWEIFPLAQFLAHDKAAMTLHNLGQAVTNREVLTWVLGLGFGINARVSASALAQEAPREWLHWLSRLQQSVCARYIGEPLRNFQHERIGRGDGVLRADYGGVQVVANLNPHPQQISIGRQKVTLAPFGFYAAGEGMLSANLYQVGGREFGPEGVSFVLETANRIDLWVYARAGENLAVPLPRISSRQIRLLWDNDTTASGIVRQGVLAFTIPSQTPHGQTVTPPPGLVSRAPRDWGGNRLRIGVLDLPGLAPVWTDITPKQWLNTLQQSSLARRWGIQVEPIRSVDNLVKAVEAGVTRWFAIVNPYGEIFPVPSADEWRQMLEHIRRYVQNGGIWWETAGYSFYIACYPERGGWETETIGAKGMDVLGVPIGGGALEQAPEPVHVSEEGRKWLGDALSARVSGLRSVVNRGLPRGETAPPHVALLSGRRDDFIGGYRLDGWGWLWRVGGFRPNPDVVLPVATAVLEWLYLRPPVPTLPSYVRRVWHVRITV